MVQAAAVSGLDFSAGNLRSRYWWLKTRWILDRLEDLNSIELYRMQHWQHAAVLDYKIERQTFDAHWNAANDLLHKTFITNFPWAKDANKKHQQREIDSLMDEWKRRFGDPNDPAVQARFLKVAQAMRRQGEKAEKEMFADQNKLRDTLKKVMKSRRATAASASKKRGK